MRHAPHRFERSRIVRHARDDVPMNVRQLVAEEFVVDLLGSIGLCERVGDRGHVLHQPQSLRRRQVEQFRCVTLKDDDGPAGEELIIMEIGF